MTIPKTLLRRRKELGLTQHAVAGLAGITQSHLSMIERDDSDPRLSTLQDIARALRSELVLVPSETLPGVQSIVGTAPPPDQRPLFAIEPD